MWATIKCYRESILKIVKCYNVQPTKMFLKQAHQFRNSSHWTANNKLWTSTDRSRVEENKVEGTKYEIGSLREVGIKLKYTSCSYSPKVLRKYKNWVF